MFKFIDLFAGIGGFRIAFENLGCQCVFSSEWNKFSRKTYEANFNDSPEGDITLIPALTIPDHDILTAGFPCQPFSIAGVRNTFFRGCQNYSRKKTESIYFGKCQKFTES